MTPLPTSPTTITPPPLNTSFYNTLMNSSNNSSSNSISQDQLISPIKEEISTIFVVGFPEDMQEREFQNMFMFSPGFEAATLKVPNKESDDELLGSSSNNISNNNNNNNNRKQTIGFAKFRTRKEAMDSRDILNGRKVDAEKGCMLKAEMAKKNLHTKRGLLNDITASTSTVNPNSAATATTTATVNNKRYTQPAFSAYEAFYSVGALNDTNDYNDYYPDMPAVDPISRSHSVDARTMENVIKPSLSTSKYNSSNNSSRFNADESDYLSKSTPLTPNTFHNMNILFNHPISPSMTPSTGLSRVIEERNFYDTPLFYPLHSSTSTPSVISPQTPPPPGILSPTNSYRSLGGMLVGSSNPADQNPPCNTLYVGNLPPNTHEDELKAMFSRCPGYKRLSFKSKSNGPMCFVEFEDAIYAAQALQDLHGNPLSNSVKGGIRLSFSKNPLGVRQSTMNTNTYPLMNVFNHRRESVTTSNFDPQLS